MKERLYISCIRNIQKDYAKIIKYILGKDSEICDNTYYTEIETPLNTNLVNMVVDSIQANLVEGGVKSCIKDKSIRLQSVEFLQDNVINNSKTIYYIIYVLCNDFSDSTDFIEDDVVNLQYFSLIRQALENMESTKNIKLLLFVKPDLDKQVLYQKEYNALFYKASQFMSSTTKRYNGRHYAYKYERNNFFLSEMSTSHKGIWRKFSPLTEMQDYNDIEMWSCVLADLYKGKYLPELEKKGLKNIFKTIYYSGAEENVLRDYEDKIYNQNNNYYRILKLCKAYFCEIPTVSGRKRSKNRRTKKEMTKELLDKFNDDIFKFVEDMTLLAFYIMCLFISFTRTSGLEDYGKISEEEIYKWKFIANDVADGLLQLMENAISHSQFGKGFFSFRVHTNKNENKNAYLHTKYKSYFDKKEREMPYFLEVQIIDFSEFGILDKYIRDMDKKGKTAENDKKIIISEVADEIKRLSIGSLFAPNDQEREIYKRYDTIDRDNLVHHYGLQLFFSMVESSEGCFIVKSMGWDGDIQKNLYSNVALSGKDNEYMPGTQYSILLPFKYEEKQHATSLNADINYVDYLEKEFVLVDLPIEFSKKQFVEYFSHVEIFDSKLNWQQKKEAAIDAISNKIIKIYEEEKAKNSKNDEIGIFIFDAKSIDLGCVEYFCKACIYIGIHRNDLDEIPIAIRNCSENHFLSIIRMLSVFYDKQGNTEIMEKMQIYLVGQDTGEEFIVTGKNIKTAIAAAEKLSFTKGIKGKYIEVLSNMLKRRTIEYKVESIKFIPFHLEICYDDKKTPFERGVLCVLEREIGESLFGCKIKDAHMRLGSKIHIRDFYEAELLFHNNYYTSGFAYKIIKEIDRDGVSFEKPIMIVGYETYSEMLLYEIVNLMKKRCEQKEISYADIDYMYFENKENTFRIFNNKKMDEISLDTQYIVIVPINSTLTTHDKLIALIKNDILSGKNPCIIEKFAIVLIRDLKENDEQRLSKLEKSFWESLELEEGGLPFINTKRLSGTTGHRIKYLISLRTEWLDPLKCRYCFPNENEGMYYTEELPLIETDKASVVPIQKIRLKESKAFDGESFDKNILMSNNERVKELSKYLVYKHIERNNNHYSYYFETEKFMKGEKNNIGKWLENECKNMIKEENNILTYDILVAPLHYSNTAFVEEVNMRVFKGASLVLHFDVEKEFRENISTKFSNIKVLYENLLKSKRKAIIRFHYVDDMIVSGNTFYRMKSVIQSIFTREMIEAKIDDTGIKIDIFYSIFLLLNRCSTATKYNYINDLHYYFSYVDLFISSMRNHEDACVLCKTLKEYNSLKSGTATNALIKHWDANITKHRVYKLPGENKIGFWKMETSEYESDENEQKARARRRVICSHNAAIMLNSVLKKCINEQEETQKIKRAIVTDLFFKDSNRQRKELYEYIISYIKVLSRPFFIFSRTEKNAIFSLMLQMIDYILFGEDSVIQGNEFENEYIILKDWLENYCYDNLNEIKGDIQKSKEAYILLITLMKRLSGLGSTYVIRERNVDRIWKYFNYIKNQDDNIKKNFVKRYLAMVKRNMSLSSDEMKCIYLEYMILQGKEYIYEKKGECENLLGKEKAVIYSYFFLENNRVIIDAVNDLHKDFEIKGYKLSDLKERDLIEILNEYYYYLNFRRLLDYYSICSVENKIEYKIVTFSEKNFKIMKAFILLATELKDGNDNADVAERYKRIREYICEITDAESANIYVTDNQNPLIFDRKITDQNKEIEVYKLGEKETERFHPKVKITLPSGESELDTYVLEYDQHHSKVIISTENQENHTHIISFVLEFKEKERKDIYIGLKLFLVFWSKMIHYMENDLKNNLIEKWKSAQEFQYQITKSRAKDHTDDDVLHMALIDLRDKYRKEIPKVEEVSKMLQLIVNMYIARLNARALIFENKDIPIKEIVQKTQGKCKFEDLYENYLKSMINILSFKNRFDLYFENEISIPNELAKRTIRYVKIGEITKYPPLHHLSIIIMECILSAIKNGKKQNNKVRIDIVQNGKYLIIQNELKKEDKASEIKDKIDKAMDRENEGISLITIKRYFIDFYGKDGDVKIVVESNKFAIGLPIIQIRRKIK